MKNRIKDETGQHLIILALMLPILLGAIGLVMDLGMVYAQRQRAQNAADAAVMAGAAALCTSGTTVATTRANDYVVRNGFTTAKATISFPSLGAGFDTYVRVDIADTYAPAFVSMVWRGSFPIKARATAGCKGSAGMGTVLILNKTAAQSFFMNGTAKIDIRPGNLHVDSSHSQAVYINGVNTLTSQAATSMVGGYFVNGVNTITPWPMVTGAPYKPDPLASVPEPAYDASGAGYTSRSNPNYNGTGPWAALQPGIYNSGISVNGTGTLNLNPGNYIVKGSGIFINGTGPVNFGAGRYVIQGSGPTSGLLINGTGTITFGTGEYIVGGTDFMCNGTQTLKGTNVFFYIDSGTTLTINGTERINFSPPASGTYAGILWFQKRSNTKQATINGTPTVAGYGGIHYFPSATLLMNGTGDYDISMIVDKFFVNGTQQINIQGWSGAMPSKPTWSLIE